MLHSFLKIFNKVKIKTHRISRWCLIAIFASWATGGTCLCSSAASRFCKIDIWSEMMIDAVGRELEDKAFVAVFIIWSICHNTSFLSITLLPVSRFLNTLFDKHKIHSQNETTTLNYCSSFNKPWQVIQLNLLQHSKDCHTLILCRK